MVNTIWNIIIGGVIFAFGMLFMDYCISKNDSKHVIESELQKRKIYFDTMNLWIYSLLRGKKISSYLYDNGYKRVIIYGMSEIGERLYQELKQEGIDIICVIDRRYRLGDFCLIKPCDRIPDADLIVVTAEKEFIGISEELRKKTEIPIVSILELMNKSFGVRFA